MQLTVYVPLHDAYGIAPGSAIVGGAIGGWQSQGQHTRYETVDFEGGVHSREYFAAFATRLLHAAGRHADHYPTSARVTLPMTALRLVGWYDYERGRPAADNRLDVHDSEALDAWIARFEGA
jgi:hypothetical protein